MLAAAKPVHSAEMAQGATQGANPEFKPDVEIELSAETGELAILRGSPTRVWQFRGKVIRGDPDAFHSLPGSALPVIQVRKGQKIRVHFWNRISQESIVHWHGLHVPQEMDGHPRTAIRPGERFVYEFTVNNRAGTYWFHPHPHGRTGEQVYLGLAGLFIVSDDEEAAAQLPNGELDLAWIIQDRTFADNNQLVYLRGMMDRMMGFLGERDPGQRPARTSCNGRDNRVPRAPLNGSNSRIYKLAWNDGRPLTVIGTDGGLLERPVQRPYVTLAPAERVELWLDFSDRSVGDLITLSSLPFSSGGGPMGGAGGAGAFPVLTVRVERKIVKTHTLATKLSSIPRYRLEDAVNRDSPRIFRLEMGMGRVALNGRSFEMEDRAWRPVKRWGSITLKCGSSPTSPADDDDGAPDAHTQSPVSGAGPPYSIRVSRCSAAPSTRDFSTRARRTSCWSCPAKE